jgi:hypothetical protein
MGRAWVAAIAVCLVLLAGCGTDEETGGGAEAPAALGYVPRDAYAVAVVPTDLDSEQLRRFERLIEPSLHEAGDGTLRGELASLLEGADRTFERDVEPLLGGSLVLAAWGDLDAPQILAALELPEGARPEQLLVKLGMRRDSEHGGAQIYDDGVAAIDERALLVWVGEPGRGKLEQAIDRRRAGDGLDGAAFEDALPDDVGDALLQIVGDPRALALPEMQRAAELPWVRALRSYGMALQLEDDRIVGRLRVRTDAGELGEDDLPLAPGDETPEVGDVDGAIAAGNRDQSRTTVFLAQVARKAFPDSQFVREVEALEADLGISFEQEVLAQFNGPSASVATPDGGFAAVSDIADPDRMRELLPRLAPRLPPILRGLQGLGNRGLLALLLVAPDAPLVPGTLPALTQGIEVQSVPGGEDELLFRLAGLDEPGPGGEPPFAGPGEVVFGMIADRFVVASDEQRARTVSEMDVAAIEDAQGAAVARADFGTWSREAVDDASSVGTVPLGEAVGELEASTDGLEGRLRIEVPGGLD